LADLGLVQDIPFLLPHPSFAPVGWHMLFRSGHTYVADHEELSLSSLGEDAIYGKSEWSGGRLDSFGNRRRSEEIPIGLSQRADEEGDSARYIQVQINQVSHTGADTAAVHHFF
jgi:hypothetical protein